MSSQITRKELREDKFAVEVEHTVDFFTAHRQKVMQYGGAAVAVAVVVGGAFYFMNYQTATRQKALGDAISASAAPITQAPSPNGALSFQTDAAKKDAVTKAFTKVAADFAGKDEGYVAEYFLGSQLVENIKFDDARKKFQDVADHAESNYASLARLALAQIDFAEGRNDEATKLLKDLIDHPTDMVSKEQAQITLAKGLAPTKPEDARSQLTSIKADAPEVTAIVAAAMSELPKK